MKVLLRTLLVLAPVALSAQITGSKHDLSAKFTNVNSQLCIFCHTPHNAPSVAGRPLWNHADATATTWATYTTTSGTSGVGIPGPASLTCLSCHDGTISVGSILINGGRATPVVITATAGPGIASPSGFMVGANLVGNGTTANSLSSDHPVGVTYVATAGEYNAIPVNATQSFANTVRLFTSKVECASCHDVHNPGAAGTTAPFLRTSNSASALCITCHIK